MNFWKDGLSIDETKLSMTIVCMIAVIGTAIWSYFTRGDITNNMLVLAQTFVYAVAGVNAVSGLSNLIGNFTQKSTDTETSNATQNTTTENPVTNDTRGEENTQTPSI